MSAHQFGDATEPFLAACVCPRFAAWLRAYPQAAFDLAKIVPAEASAVTLRRADLAGVINAPRERGNEHASAVQERRHV